MGLKQTHIHWAVFFVIKYKMFHFGASFPLHEHSDYTMYDLNGL